MAVFNRRTIRLGLLLLPLFWVMTVRADPGPGESSVEVVSLETEHRMNPLGIDAREPCLGWQLNASTRGARQTAYRIQVAESQEALSQGEELLWDSGRVDSDQSVHHAYEGPPLDPQQRYFWRVRVWDESGQPSTWSAPAWWEMGLLDASDWQADWIEPGLDQDSSTPAPSPMLRSEFEVDAPIQSARLYVTSHGLYEMHLNGERVGDQVFTPGWTSYDHRLQYQTYDVTERLDQGQNALGALLGDGWYRGYIGFEGQRNYYGDTLALLAQLHVTYEDGRTEIVARTDEGWRATTGPIRKSDLYEGETYDARREKPGWAHPGYDATEWTPVQVAEHEKERLIASTAPPVRRIQEISPAKVLYTPEGDTVLDMGQNMVGWMRMRVEGEAGTEVTLRHAEVLDKDGNFYTKNLRSADQTNRYVLKGKGEEVYEPHFTFQGFRYVDVSGYPGEVKPENFTGVVIHSDMTPTGHFESSNPLLNQLQHNIVWGQKGNFLDIPTDCPQRDERLGWTGDIQVFARTAAFNMDTGGFLSKWLKDLEADQHEDGRIPHVIPDVLSEEAAGAAGWADAGVIVPWTMYQESGNERILETQYESMKAWVEYMRKRARKESPAYLWDNDFTFGDWLAYSTDNPDYPGATTSKDLIATAYYARSADLLARSAEVLGRKADAQEYRRLFEQVRQTFQDEFVTPNGRVTSDTQTSYVLALSFDLLPEEQRETAAQYLAEDVRSHGHLTTGFLGTPDLAHVLGEYGYWKEAYDLLLRTEYPSWLYPVTRDATTIWERWDGIKPDSTFQDPGMNSFNHYAYGAIGEWLYEKVAGIEATAPGYEEIRIAPQPGGELTHARAFLDSEYGRIESDWTRQGGQFRLNVTIPPNTEATVRLPNADRESVTENGQPLADVEAVTSPRQDGSDVVLEVGAGTYEFVYESDTPSGSSDRDTLGVSTPLGELLADQEARATLREQLPALMDSPWLSQAMGFPLEQVEEVVPLDVSSKTLRAIDQALQQSGR